MAKLEIEGEGLSATVTVDGVPITCHRVQLTLEAGHVPTAEIGVFAHQLVSIALDGASVEVVGDDCLFTDVPRIPEPLQRALLAYLRKRFGE